MVYNGIILKDGRLELEGGVRLPEGTAVTVAPVLQDDKKTQEDKKILLSILDLAWPSGIPDLASQHDHYIYGTPRQSVE